MGKDVKKMIFDATLSLLKDRELKDVTVNEICRAAGVVKSTFYYYYTSKEEVLTGAYDEGMRQAVERLPEILLREKPPEEKLMDIWALNFAYVLAYDIEVLRHVVCAGVRSGNGSLFCNDTGETARLHSVMESLLEMAQREGRAAGNATAAEYIACANRALGGLNIQYCAADGGFDYAAQAARTVRLILGIS